MDVLIEKKVEIEVTVYEVRDKYDKLVPMDNAFADGDDDLIIQLDVSMPTEDQQMILDYLERKNITTKSSLAQLLEELPF